MSEEAAAAAALFGHWMTITDARALVTRYPACVPHALALAEEISRPHVTNPAGLLHRLVERGWTPPARVAPPPLNADDPLRFLRNGATGRCMLCDEPLEICGGIHVPAWAREPAHAASPPGKEAAAVAIPVAADIRSY